jgi:hypothetical protein
MQEDPAPAELVSWQDTASGEVEDGGERHVQQFSDFVRVEDVVAGEARARCRGGGEGRHRQILGQTSQMREIWCGWRHLGLS